MAFLWNRNSTRCERAFKGSLSVWIERVEQYCPVQFWFSLKKKITCQKKARGPPLTHASPTFFCSNNRVELKRFCQTRKGGSFFWIRRDSRFTSYHYRLEWVHPLFWPNSEEPQKKNLLRDMCMRLPQQVFYLKKNHWKSVINQLLGPLRLYYFWYTLSVLIYTLNLDHPLDNRVYQYVL